jgi:hypothetical protein
MQKRGRIRSYPSYPSWTIDELEATQVGLLLVQGDKSTLWSMGQASVSKLKFTRKRSLKLEEVEEEPASSYVAKLVACGFSAWLRQLAFHGTSMSGASSSTNSTTARDSEAGVLVVPSMELELQELTARSVKCH